MGRIGAAARFRELGAELRKCRKVAKVTAAQVAFETGWNPSKISRVESGHQVVSEVDVIQYLAACGVYLGKAHGYLALCHEANRYRRYWLSPHDEHLQDSVKALIFQEAAASASTFYEPQVVHGLLQTESYARAMISRESWRTDENVEFCVRARLERQRILRRPTPARLEFFMHEAALRLEIGSAAIMHEQLLTLALVSGLPSVAIRIVPASAGMASVFGGAFQLFRFAEHQPLVYLDAYIGGLFLEDQDFVETYRQLVPAIAAVALDEGQSREFVAALAGEFDRGSDQSDGHDRVEEKQL